MLFWIVCEVRGRPCNIWFNTIVPFIFEPTAESVDNGDRDVAWGVNEIKGSFEV